jgi:general secretion pathway protein A
VHLAFYHLREDPFRLTPDPRFLHLAEPHRVAFTTLVKSVTMRKGITVLTGPVGTGKTTLLHFMLRVLTERSTDANRLSAAFLWNPTLTREEFLEVVLDELEIDCSSTSKPRRLSALHQRLLETQRKGGTALLLVDEAHLLTGELLEEIRLLSNLDTYGAKLLQIVLAGQPELSELLAQPQARALQQRIMGRCELRALSLAETRAYVAQRLHVAGLQGASPFLPRALEAIHGLSGGVPRVTNQLCDCSLEIGFEAKRILVGPDTVEEAAATLGLLESPAARSSSPSAVSGAGTGTAQGFPQVS